MILPDPGIEPVFLLLAGGFFTAEPLEHFVKTLLELLCFGR